jgi:hypothetical protein
MPEDLYVLKSCQYSENQAWPWWSLSKDFSLQLKKSREKTPEDTSHKVSKYSHPREKKMRSTSDSGEQFRKNIISSKADKSKSNQESST